MMFKKILIANRGEIACRVIKTAQKLGIKTVAVYSDADKNALHVEMADEAIHIGGSPAAQSYLLGDKIIAACKETGAQAVHPGYGFLSENADFCEQLTAAGLVFIGPPPKAIAAMGDKITSKKLAAEANVSTVPGYMGLISDAEDAVKISNEVGYPVMIKASAGGGGKGMRVAWNDDEAREGFALSKSEAASSFGDDRIFIEKFVTDPRHIEIQVLADSHGNCIYLGERECSIQRRNQKVIEEAPSPFLDEATRQKMGEQSVALAQAVGYTSAGTVEFIVDGDRNFYFLEMNTRLQVEHPVTELITGLDLVEQMLRIAAGEKLSFQQSDVKLNGWAMESRLYAEDPYRNFLPSVGRLTRYRPPAEGVSADGTIIRNDTGVFEGGEISTFYDPMIAKLCTWAETRAEAINIMGAALDQFEVEGIGHNIPFLSAVMGHDRFRSGNITTAFIDEEFPDGFAGATLRPQETKTIAALSAIIIAQENARFDKLGNIPSGAPTGYPVSLTARVAGQAFNLEIAPVVDAPKGTFTVAIEGGEKEQFFCDYTPGNPLVLARSHNPDGTVGGGYALKATKIAGGLRVRTRGADLKVYIYTPRVAELALLMPVKLPPDMSKFLLCPMPGQIMRLEVAEGEIVEDGQTLAVVEAMKMENVLKAQKRAKVSKIRAGTGDNLAVDEIIMEFEDV